MTAEYQERKRELKEERRAALMKVLRLQHTAGPGGQAICICGANNGGSLACLAVKELLNIEELYYALKVEG